jgi:Ca-activated chloride channel family protein
MDSIQDFYAILGVPETATERDIRQAYRLAALRFHPDVNNTPGIDSLFQEINEAHDILSDKAKRRYYDQQRATLIARRPPALELAITLSRYHLRRSDDKQIVYALLNIRPRLSVVSPGDVPINLCIVVDRSKSMAGARLQSVKTALYQVIEDCRPEDVISVVTFSDRAEVIVPATNVTDPYEIKSKISVIRADGSTEIFQGLQLGMSEIEKFQDNIRINHLVLITDGRTYGDEQECLALAGRAKQRGVGISGVGIGQEWNDDFLDELASKTGGSSTYIEAPHELVEFMHNRVRSLSTAYAERLRLAIMPPPEVHLDSIMRLSPDPLDVPIHEQPISLGTVEGQSSMSLMAEYHVNTGLQLGEFFIGRIDLKGEVLGSDKTVPERIIQDLTVNVSDEQVVENPPTELLDALNKLRFYRVQNNARSSLEDGQVSKATTSLEHLATRLFEVGEEELGRAALHEAQRVAHVHSISDEGSKRLKYGTRAFLSFSGD